MSVTTPHNTPASQAGDIEDQLHQAKLAFSVANELVEDVANNIVAFRQTMPNVGGGFGAHEGMCYAMTCLHDELQTLEMQVQELRNRLKAERTSSPDRRGRNDQRLCQIAREYRQLVEKDWEGDAPHKRALMDELLGTPADSIVGIAAKLHAVSNSRAPEPNAPGDALEHRAMAEVERLGGFADAPGRTATDRVSETAGEDRPTE